MTADKRQFWGHTILYRTSIPDFLFSVLSVMLSRSPKRSLVINWWCVGTMLVCRLDAVSASSCSRFSLRCSSNIFCKGNQIVLYPVTFPLICPCDTFITTQKSRIFQNRYCRSWFLNFDILTSLSPWRLRSTSSGLSPCAGDESGMETERQEYCKHFHCEPSHIAILLHHEWWQ